MTNSYRLLITKYFRIYVWFKGLSDRPKLSFDTWREFNCVCVRLNILFIVLHFGFGDTYKGA